MAICVLSTSTFIVGFIASIAAPLFARKYLLRFTKERRVLLAISAAMFIAILLVMFIISNVCVPLGGENTQLG